MAVIECKVNLWGKDGLTGRLSINALEKLK